MIHIKRFLTRLYIAYWWLYTVHEDNFHESLRELPNDRNGIAAKRQVASFLKYKGLSVTNLLEIPNELVDDFLGHP